MSGKGELDMDIDSAVQAFWGAKFTADVRYQDARTLVVVRDPGSGAGLLLEQPDGTLRLALTPEQAARLPDGGLLRVGESVRSAVAAGGLTLDDPGLVYYLTSAAAQSLLNQSGDRGEDGGVRRLDAADEAVFSQFQSLMSHEDLEEAEVELDDWLVLGVFERERLVAAASAYLEDGTTIADVGVITVPEVRGQGHGRRAVAAISRHLLAFGYVPQYRADESNTASRELARVTGFALFGTCTSVLGPG